jgi:hypothetical protein
MRWFLILPRLGARLYWMAALRHKRPIRNGRLGENKRQDGFDAMVFGSL